MKITKIQNEFKIISVLTPEEIKRLEKVNQNVVYEDKKPVFGISMSDTLPQFTGKAVTFNEVSDSGKAMLTLCCDKDIYEQFASEDDAIKHFSEEYLEAINNLASAEEQFKTALNALDARITDVIKSVKTIKVD